MSSSPTKCSSEVQQPYRTEPTACDPHWPSDLRQRPSATFLPLDGKEKVTGSIRSRVVDTGRSVDDDRGRTYRNIAEINEVTTGAVVRQALDSIEDQAHEREICPEPLRTVEIASLGQPARCQYQPEVGNPRAQDVACWP